MKTRELIAALQREDPDGDKEVVVGGKAVYRVEWQPGYYDGHYTKLIQDGSSDWPTGAIITRVGRKVEIFTIGWSDLLWENPEAPIMIDESANWSEDDVRAIRKESRKVDDDVKAFAVEHAKDHPKAPEEEKGGEDGAGEV